MNANPDVGRMRETFRFSATEDGGSQSGLPIPLPDGLPAGLSPRQALIGLAVLGVIALVISKGRDDTEGVQIYQ